MCWIQTYDRKIVYPFKITEDQISIQDIAQSLSLLCRYNGHCNTFYSVAEHSVRMSYLCSGKNSLWALLHDAAEAYISDIPKPVKDKLHTYGGYNIGLQSIDSYEDDILRVIAKKFDLYCENIPLEIKHYDIVMAATEGRDLMGGEIEDWGLQVDPLEEVIVPWTWEESKEKFLARFEELIVQPKI